MKIGDLLVAKRVGMCSAFLYSDYLCAKPAVSDNLIGVGLAGGKVPGEEAVHDSPRTGRGGESLAEKVADGSALWVCRPWR